MACIRDVCDSGGVTVSEDIESVSETARVTRYKYSITKRNVVIVQHDIPAYWAQYSSFHATEDEALQAARNVLLGRVAKAEATLGVARTLLNKIDRGVVLFRVDNGAVEDD